MVGVGSFGDILYGSTTLNVLFYDCRGAGSFGDILYGSTTLNVLFCDCRGAGSFGDILYGSCEYASVRDGVPRDYSDLPFDKSQVAALAQKDPDYPGSCGRCYELR